MCSVCSDIRMNKKVASLVSYDIITAMCCHVSIYFFRHKFTNCKSFYAGGVSIVKQHVRVFNAWICDLPRQGIDIFLPYA